jgi:hypothetical protein
VLSGASGVNVSHGSGDYAKLENLYAEFEYIRKDDPLTTHTGIFKYIPSKDELDVASVIEKPVEDVTLGYFGANGVANPVVYAPEHIKGKTYPKLSAVAPGKPGSVLIHLEARRWIPGYVRAKKR